MAPAQSKPAAKKAATKTATKTPQRKTSKSSANAAAGTNAGANENKPAANPYNPYKRQGSTQNSSTNAAEDVLQFLRDNSAPLGSSIRIAGSPKSASSGPRQSIIVIQVLHKPGGIHGFLYGFRRLEEPDKGTYIEKIHRDQIRSADAYLLGPPLNILRATYGAHENGVPLLNEKGYELSSFVSLQNFEGKVEQAVRQLARVFATAIKQHVERDPGCQNQEIIVSDDNIHYNADNVFMDFIGEKNAVNLYRTILPVDSTPGYSQFYPDHALSFFREGQLNPHSVAFIKADDRFLAPEYRAPNERNDGQEPADQPDHNQEQAPAGEN